MYKCYLLKKLDPLNPKYPLIDLVDHVIAIFPIFNKDHNTETILETVDVYLEGLDDETDLKGEVDAETRFRKFAHHKFIKSRQKALEYIREGMTLNGTSYFFSHVIIFFVTDTPQARSS